MGRAQGEHEILQVRQAAARCRAGQLHPALVRQPVSQFASGDGDVRGNGGRHRDGARPGARPFLPK